MVSLSNLRKLLSEEHKGIGGLYFLTSTFICAVMTMFILNTSYASQCVAMADNLAYIVSINTSVYSYERNMDSYITTNPNILLDDGSYYVPLNEFNSLLRNSGIAKTNCSEISVSWDKNAKIARINLGSFVNQMGTEIIPHAQESHITQ